MVTEGRVRQGFGWGALLLVAVFAAVAQAEELTGKPQAVSGDRLEVAGVIVRLNGITAPAPDAVCTNDGRPWNCGQEATFALAFELAEHWVTCETAGTAPDGAVLASCRIGPYNLAERMVRKGWAAATDERYAEATRQAKAAGLGIWQKR